MGGWVGGYGWVGGSKRRFKDYLQQSKTVPLNLIFLHKFFYQKTVEENQWPKETQFLMHSTFLQTDSLVKVKVDC